MIKLPEIFHIHALAKLAFDASANGSRPIPSDRSFHFLREILSDQSLQTRNNLELFDECFSLEIELQKRQ